MSEQQHGARTSLQRIFCAVELPAEVRAQVAAHIAALYRAAQGTRVGWEREGKLHLTLKFLGEIEPERTRALERATARAAAQVSPFEITIEGTGAFPPKGPPRVLWMGVRDEASGLVQLQAILEDECEREGFQREQRAFHPHLTIARIRDPKGTRPLVELHRETPFTSDTFVINSITVMHSQLAPGGSRYTPLSHHTLKGS